MHEKTAIAEANDGHSCAKLEPHPARRHFGDPELIRGQLARHDQPLRRRHGNFIGLEDLREPVHSELHVVLASVFQDAGNVRRPLRRLE
jgi:hypothetical protein